MLVTKLPNEPTKKILMAVANNTYPADPRVRNEAQTLADAGYQVTVIAPQGKGQPNKETINGVHILRFPLITFGEGKVAYALEFSYVTLATFWCILKVWMSVNFDIIHVHNAPDTLFASALLPIIFGKKLIYDHHDLAPELYLAKYDKTGGPVYKILRQLERLSCLFAYRVITVNESYKVTDAERNHKKLEHITVVRNGPPLHHLEEVSPDPDLRTRAAILFGYLGVISKQDGVDHLIRALHHLTFDLGFTDWHCIIMGNADNQQDLNQLAKELKVLDKLEFTGYLSAELWRRNLATVDICVVPDPKNALNEKSTMIKMMDYMAMGKAVVAYDMTENRFSGAEAAMYATASDPKAMAKVFLELIENPKLRAELGEKGKLRIKEALAWEYSAKELINFYKGI